MTWKELIIKVLNESDRPLSVRELWKYALNKHYDKMLGNKTVQQAEYIIAAYLYTAIKKKHWPDLRSVGSKPMRFYLASSSNLNSQYLQDYEENREQNKSEETQGASVSQTTHKVNSDIIEIFKERDLHKYLAYFLYKTSKIYTKTIFHEVSEKKKYAKWLHPDLVGVYFSFEDYGSEVINIAKELGKVGLKLFSYEVKKELNFNNLRESYFQAVSNSSWANEGYLVVVEIDESDEFLNELKRLNAAFGIGIIKLDLVDPNNTKILLHSKEREKVDMETMNKISGLNDNFKEFLKRVLNDFANKEIVKERYDHIYNYEDLLIKF